MYLNISFFMYLYIHIVTRFFWQILDIIARSFKSGSDSDGSLLYFKIILCTYIFICLCIFIDDRNSIMSDFRGVYMISIIDNGQDIPSGTAFAFSPNRILTCHHCIFDEEILENNIITSPARRYDNCILSATWDNSCPQAIPIVFECGNVDDDWAIFKCVDADFKFSSYFTLSKKFRKVGRSLMSYSVPIKFLKNNSYPLQPISSSWSKISMRNINRVLVEGGSLRGCSGAPCIDKDREVVGMHLCSINEAEDIDIAPKSPRRTISELRDELDSVSSHSNEIAHNHKSFSVCLIINTINDIMNKI
jgi:hypothetical protein